MTLVRLTVRDAWGEAPRYLWVPCDSLAAVIRAREMMASAIREGAILEMLKGDRISTVYVCTGHVLSFSIDGVESQQEGEA